MRKKSLSLACVEWWLTDRTFILSSGIYVIVFFDNHEFFLLQPEEDVSQFKFSKFAATYFQGGVTPAYIRKPLKQSLLPLTSEADSMVSDRHIVMPP